MEGQKKGSSSSSFTADLFGAKEYSPPQQSTGLFASIFPPPSKVYVSAAFNGYMSLMFDMFH